MSLGASRSFVLVGIVLGLLTTQKQDLRLPSTSPCSVFGSFKALVAQPQPLQEKTGTGLRDAFLHSWDGGIWIVLCKPRGLPENSNKTLTVTHNPQNFPLGPAAHICASACRVTKEKAQAFLIFATPAWQGMSAKKL